MKAIGLTNFGDPGTFEEIEVNLPELNENQVSSNTYLQQE